MKKSESPEEETMPESSSQHTLCLTWSGGRRKYELPPQMRWNEFCWTVVNIISSSTTTTTKVLELRTGFPQRRIVECYGNPLARTVIPPNTLLHCRMVELRNENDNTNENNHNSMKDSPFADAVEQNQPKKRKSPPTIVNDETNKENNDGTKVLVPRLQQEEQKRGAVEIVDLTEDDCGDVKESGDVVKESDKALALRLQKEEYQNLRITNNSTTTHRTNSTMNRRFVDDDDDRDPTRVTHKDHWIFSHGRHAHQHSQIEPILGKWLVFAGQDKIASVWNQVRRAIQSGKLASPQAKVGTKFHNTHEGYGKAYCICVYTTRTATQTVGMQLISLVRCPSISFKTDTATKEGRYRKNGDQNICIAHMYWNDGRPGSQKRARLWTLKKSKKEANLVKQDSAAALTQSFDDRIVTVTAGWNKSNYFSSSAEAPLLLVEGKTTFRLVREPENHHDPNAIRIIVDTSTSPGQTTIFGYVLAKQACVLAPWLDRGLVEIDTLTMLHRVSDTTLTVRIKGRACQQAMSMLECF